MQQDFFKRMTVAATVVGLLFTTFTACTGGSDCRDVKGRWSNGEGQELVFMENNKGYWLTRFGSDVDTMELEYRLDCGKQPVTLDFTNFKNGPHVGHSLLGILEFSSDTSFRLHYDIDARPEAFDTEQSQRFVREGE